MFDPVEYETEAYLFRKAQYEEAMPSDVEQANWKSLLVYSLLNYDRKMQAECLWETLEGQEPAICRAYLDDDTAQIGALVSRAMRGYLEAYSEREWLKYVEENIEDWISERR